MIAKLPFNFAMVLVCLILPTICNAQSSKTKIQAAYKDKSLELVLLELELNYRLKFKVDKNLIKGKSVTVSVPRLSLDDAMKLILNGMDLDYELIDSKTVFIFSKETQNNEINLVEPAVSPPQRFDFTLSGVVYDKTNGERLPFANVAVLGAVQGASTNNDGYFTLFEVPSDTIILEVSYLGYQTLAFRLNPELVKQDIKIELEPYTRQLLEVEIVANKKEQLLQASTGISKIGMSPAQLATLPSFGEKDVFRSLQLIPGVSGTNESSSGLFVRGGTPDQNLVLFDGFTVYHVDHLFGFFSAFNANAIKDVQLYKGGFDAKFGGRLSSVVELTGKDGNKEEFNAGMGLSLLSYNGFVESPFAQGKGSILLAARRSFQSNFYNNLFDAFTNSNDGPPGAPEGFAGRFGQTETQPNSYFYDLNAKVNYQLGKNNISLSFYNGQDNLDNSRSLDNNSLGGRFGGNNNNVTFQSDNADLTNWGNWGTSFKWSRKWSSTWYSNLNLSYSNYYSERDRSNATTINRTDTTIVRNTGSYEFNDLRDYSLKWDNEWNINARHQLDFGIQATYNDIAYNFTQNDTTEVINRQDEGLIGAFYLSDRFNLSDRFILTGGLRTTYYQEDGNFYWEPRASFTWLANDLIKFKGAWGRYYQFANRIVREDIQQGSRDFWLLADGEQVPVGFSEHFIAGASLETSSWLFDVEAYYKQLDGLSEYSTRFVPAGFGPNRQLAYEEFFYQGDGIAQGLEMLIQKKTGSFTGWLSYTLGRVRYDFPAFSEDPFPANQDQTHELKLVGNYKWKKWDFSATFIYATGRPYTAPTGYYEVPLLDGNSASFFEISDKNAIRLPDYHRFDVAATYNFRFGSAPASLGLSVFNVYNRNNIWYKEYEVIEGELIETDVTLLDFTPSLFFNFRFK